MKRRKFVRLIGVGTIGIVMAPRVFASNVVRKIDNGICKSAWGKLCGTIGNVYKTDAFKYIKPVRRKPNVLLYGDSISIGYTSMARKTLEDKVTVFRLFKNGGSSHQFISNMDVMYNAMFQPHLKKGWSFKWDLIHFNVGLHDLKYLKGKHLNKKGQQVSSISEYKTNLDAICKYMITKFPKATLVFATTTPVPENAKGRFIGDSVKFNRAAMEVLAIYPDIVINDLYSFTKPNMEQWAQAPGNVHYNDLGKTEQGKKVAQIIAGNL